MTPVARLRVRSVGAGGSLVAMTDHDHTHTHDMDVLQQIIVRLTKQHAGGDRDAVRAELVDMMQAAGLATGASKWIDDTAAEIAAGRLVVTDAHHDVRPPEDATPADESA